MDKTITPKQSPERQLSQLENSSLEEVCLFIFFFYWTALFQDIIFHFSLIFQGRNRLNIINNDLKNLTKGSYSPDNLESKVLDVSILIYFKFNLICYEIFFDMEIFLCN